MTLTTISSPAPSWVFDPLPPSGAMEGGRASLHVLDASLDNFVREVIQNSLDQSSGAGPVRMRFRLTELDGHDRDTFIETCGGSSLIEHLRGAAASDSPFSRSLSETLTGLEGSPLRVLTIEDSGTGGLTGGEFEAGGNFKSLCRDWLMTAESDDRRGGSYGIGKAVLWRFSALSTVLFSSRIEEETRSGMRFIGRTELPYHEAAGVAWGGPGWFGQPAGRKSAQRAESVWDEQAEQVARAIGAFRPIQMGAGTTIVIPGFHDPLADEDCTLQELGRALEEAAIMWYWPALGDGRLRVSVLSGSEADRQCVPDAQSLPHLTLLGGDPGATGMKISKPGDIATRSIPFKIPARKGRLAPDGTVIEPRVRERRASLELRVLLLPEDGDPVEGEGRIACMRGSGMVLDLHRPMAGAPAAGRFVAVLLAGGAHGDGPADQALERFLRACEPPAHDKWIATERAQALYERGSGARIRRLWSDVDRALSTMLEGQGRKRRKGPQRLAKMFPMGGPGKGPARSVRFKVDPVVAEFEGGSWTFSGGVRASVGEAETWQFRVRPALDSDGGGVTRLPIQSLEAPGCEVFVSNGHVVVPAGTQEVTFTGKAIGRLNDVDAPDPLRTRLRIEVIPKEGAST